MSKSVFLSAAVVAATLVALPATSQATDCLHLNRLGTRTTAVVDGTGRVLTRVGDGFVRVGDRMFGWMFCNKRHRV